MSKRASIQPIDLPELNATATTGFNTTHGLNFGPLFQDATPESSTSAGNTPVDRALMSKVQGEFAFASSGLIYACCGAEIITISPSLSAKRFAGNSPAKALAEGHRMSQARFPQLGGIVVISHPRYDWKHTVLVTELVYSVIIRIKGNFAKVYAGTSESGQKDGPRRTASFNRPELLSRTASGILIIAQKGIARLRLLATDGMVSTIHLKSPLLDMVSPGLTSPSSVLYLPKGTATIFEKNLITGTEQPKFPRWSKSATKDNSELVPQFGSGLAFSPSSGAAIFFSDLGSVSIGRDEETGVAQALGDLFFFNVNHAAFSPTGRLWYSNSLGLLSAKVESLPNPPILTSKIFANSNYPTLPPHPSSPSSSQSLNDLNRDVMKLIAPGILETNFSDCLRQLPSIVLERFLSAAQGKDDAFVHLEGFSSRYETMPLDELANAVLLLKPLSRADFRLPKAKSSLKHLSPIISAMRQKVPTPIELSIYHSYLSLLISAIATMTIKDQVRSLVLLKPTNLSESTSATAFTSLNEIERELLSLVLLDLLASSMTDYTTAESSKAALKESGDATYINTQLVMRLARLQFKKDAEPYSQAESLQLRLKTDHRVTTPSRLLKNLLQSLWSSLRSPLDSELLISNISTFEADEEMPMWDVIPFPEPNFELKLLESVHDLPLHSIRELKVHDWLLYARWPFFRAMVSSGLVESRERQLSLPSDFPLEAFISFVYTSKVPSTLSLSDALFIVERGLEYSWVDFGTDDSLPDFTPLFLKAQMTINQA